MMLYKFMAPNPAPEACTEDCRELKYRFSCISVRLLQKSGTVQVPTKIFVVPNPDYAQKLSESHEEHWYWSENN